MNGCCFTIQFINAYVLLRIFDVISTPALNPLKLLKKPLLFYNSCNSYNLFFFGFFVYFLQLKK